MGLTASCRAGLRPPGGNRLLREPDREASALAQGGVVLGPVRHPVPLLGDMVTASGIGFERHGRDPRSGGRSPPMPSSFGRQIAYSCNKAAPRMHAALRAEGYRVSRGRVERLMRRHGIRALARRRFRPATTDSRHQLPISPNLLQQKFTASGPNRVWLADMTYIPTGEGWLYLAAVLDLATRKVVGWAMRDHMRTELTLAALIMAAQRQRPGPGLIHHSDSQWMKASSRAA